MKFNIGIIIGILMLSMPPNIYAMNEASTSNQEEDDHLLALSLQQIYENERRNTPATPPARKPAPARKRTPAGKPAPARKPDPARIPTPARKPAPARIPTRQLPTPTRVGTPSAPSGTIRLPDCLAGKNITHLRVCQQGVNECGSHATINARIIQALLLQGERITQDNILRGMTEFRHHIVRCHQLTDGEVLGLAGNIGLERTLIIAFNNGLSTYTNGKKRIARERNGDQVSRFYIADYTHDIAHISNTLEQFLANINLHLDMAGANDFHFICNTGGHWVVISVVRIGHETFEIYYCDSVNTQLSQQSGTFKFVDFVQRSLNPQFS